MPKMPEIGNGEFKGILTQSRLSFNDPIHSSHRVDKIDFLSIF